MLPTNYRTMQGLDWKLRIRAGRRFIDRTGCEEGPGGGKGKRADGGSVNEVNGKNGKGENQSRERAEMGVAGL